nr:hypothetical protein [uncultured Desulfobacter sp.]
MQNSQLQQNSPGASQTLNVGPDLSRLIEFVSKIRADIKELGLNSDSENELNSEISTIEIQSKSPNPKSKIISESLKTIRSILEGAAGSVVATPFLAQIGNFL